MYFTTIFKKALVTRWVIFLKYSRLSKFVFLKVCKASKRRTAEVSKPVSSRSHSWDNLGRVHVVCSNFLKPNQKLCWPRGLLQDRRWKQLTVADICFTCLALLWSTWSPWEEGTVIPHFEQGMLRLREVFVTIPRPHSCFPELKPRNPYTKSCPYST